MERKSTEPFSKQFRLTNNRPVIVNSQFILQVNFGWRELEKKLPAEFAIFAPSSLEIQRSDAIVKKKELLE